MINQHLVNVVISEIDDLERDYQTNQGMILTENDLKCQLFSRLKTRLCDIMPTFDSSVTGSPLHTELKFFNEKDKLSLVPDITIISPENLSIFHSIKFKIYSEYLGGFERYSSKSYEFWGSAILIELKFCRNKTGLSNRIVTDFINDVNKMKRLQQLIRNRSRCQDKLFGICVIFNKTDLRKEKFDALLIDDNKHTDIQVLYKSGRVEFES